MEKEDGQYYNTFQLISIDVLSRDEGEAQRGAPMNVDKKVIWITGASSGIGAALAIELSKRDCKLIL